MIFMCVTQHIIYMTVALPWCVSKSITDLQVYRTCIHFAQISQIKLCHLIYDECGRGGSAMLSRWLNKVWYGEMPPCEDVRSETFASTRVRDVGP
jgi:hypothetical protein